MIKSRDYLSRIEFKQDVLEAFSALDHSVSGSLDKSQVEKMFCRIMLRLSVLCLFHGDEVPKTLLRNVAQAPESDVFALINSFLEIGSLSGTEAEQKLIEKRELQQEILHFSRIVDVYDFENTIRNKRLRNSQFIPQSLKVLCEFLTVTRSRHLQRGKELPNPRLRQSKQKKRSFGKATEILVESNSTDYLLLVKSDDKETNKDCLFLFEQLLPYLTPREAFYALTAFLSERTIDGDLNNNLSSHFYELCGISAVKELSWCSNTASDALLNSDTLNSCFALLPNAKTLSLDSESNLKLFDDSGACLTATSNNENCKAVINIDNSSIYLLSPQANSSNNCLDTLVRRAVAHCEMLNDGLISSIETGHLHLDRQIDVDQQAGLSIGKEVWNFFARTQATPPLLTPMLDDDHVLIQQSAASYREFFKENIGNAPFEIIPESSPIIRSIVCALYDRLLKSGNQKHLRYQGKNLYIDWPTENFICEVFENFQDTCITGCIFFEPALILYRSNPLLFTGLFKDRFGVDDMHAHILNLLEPNVNHDSICQRIQTYYAHFTEVTNPHKIDNRFSTQINEWIESITTPFAHLNILEDYYEVQQFKVRNLLRFLNLPLRLTTLHFSTASGRVSVERRLAMRK